MKKRRWSKEEKLAILKEAQTSGVQLTLRKYGIYPATYYSWRKKYELEGESGISDTGVRRKDKQYILQLEQEVCLLKQLLAEKELNIALQDELLKKKYRLVRKRN